MTILQTQETLVVRALMYRYINNYLDVLYIYMLGSRRRHNDAGNNTARLPRI